MMSTQNEWIKIPGVTSACISQSYSTALLTQIWGYFQPQVYYIVLVRQSYFQMQIAALHIIFPPPQKMCSAGMPSDTVPFLVPTISVSVLTPPYALRVCFPHIIRWESFLIAELKHNARLQNPLMRIPPIISKSVSRLLNLSATTARNPKRFHDKLGTESVKSFLESHVGLV